jgi:hypothetical protein
VPIFFHDTVLPRDPDGFSIWQLEHWLEHKQFIATAIAKSPPVTIPDYDLSIINPEPTAREVWLGTHSTIHDALRSMTNITSNLDLSQVDFDKDDQWFQWMDDHANEHRAIRAALNLT